MDNLKDALMIEVIDSRIAGRESFITLIGTLSRSFVCRHSINNSFDLFLFHGGVENKFFRGWIFSWDEGRLI